MHDGGGASLIAPNRTAKVQRKVLQLDEDDDGEDHEDSGKSHCLKNRTLASIHVVGCRGRGSDTTSAASRLPGRQPASSRVGSNSIGFPKSSLWSTSSVDDEDDQQSVAYPGIPFQVAKYLCESNPELVQRMEAALHNSISGRGTPPNAASSDDGLIGRNAEDAAVAARRPRDTSSLGQMAFVTDALALQQSDIGVGDARGKTSARDVDDRVTNAASPDRLDRDLDSKELHRFPRERIITQVERRSWLSASRNGTDADEDEKEHPVVTVNGREHHHHHHHHVDKSEEGCSESELDSTVSDVRSIGSDSSCTREQVRFLDALREKASLEGHLEIVVQEAERGRAEVAQLQSQLSTVRAQMGAHVALSNSKGQEVESMRRILDDAARRLNDSEDLCVGLREALDVRAVEVAQSKAESVEAECEARQLRIALQEAKVDAEARDGAVVGLKAKVAELHGLLEEATRGRSQMECELQACRRESASESKMKEWYRHQVESLQEARQTAQRDALAATADAAEARASAQRLRFEGERVGKQLADVQQRAVREKENLMRHLETIEADVREREAAALHQHLNQSGGGPLVDRIKAVETERARLAEEAYSRTQLEHKLDVANSELAERAESRARAEREAAALSSQVVVFQKTVDHNRLELDAAYERYSRLEGKCRELESALRQSQELTNSVRRDNISLEVELSSARKEKDDMDSALLDVRANVTKLDGRIRRLREELALKGRAQEALVQEKTRLEDELSIRESALEQRRRREARLEEQAKGLCDEVSRLKSQPKRRSASEIDELNDSEKLESREIGCQTIENLPYVDDDAETKDSTDPSTITLLTRKLKEALEAKKRLEGELQAAAAISTAKVEPRSSVEPSNTKTYFYRKRVASLEKKLEATQKLCDEERRRAERTQELLIEADKEKGRLLALAESAESLRRHAAALEASLAERENEIHALKSLASDSTERGHRDDVAKCQRMEELEKRLGSEQSTNRELRRQVFKEMCDAKGSRKNLSNTKESLEETGRLLEAARVRQGATQAEAAAAEKAATELKVELTELKNRLQIRDSELDAVRKELEECHAKDEMLADQMKSVGWHLHQKSQEIVRLQEEASAAEERHAAQLEAARVTADGFKREVESVAAELRSCSKEKFSYQARLTALKATKATSECFGRPDDFLIESPAPYNESLVAALLQQSLESLPDSRPLSHLRLCLDTLKQEMAILQRQLLDHD